MNSAIIKANQYIQGDVVIIPTNTVRQSAQQAASKMQCQCLTCQQSAYPANTHLCLDSGEYCATSCKECESVQGECGGWEGRNG